MSMLARPAFCVPCLVVASCFPKYHSIGLYRSKLTNFGFFFCLTEFFGSTMCSGESGDSKHPTHSPRNLSPSAQITFRFRCGG